MGTDLTTPEFQQTSIQNQRQNTTDSLSSIIKWGIILAGLFILMLLIIAGIWAFAQFSVASKVAPVVVSGGAGVG